MHYTQTNWSYFDEITKESFLTKKRKFFLHAKMRVKYDKTITHICIHFKSLQGYSISGLSHHCTKYKPQYTHHLNRKSGIVFNNRSRNNFRSILKNDNTISFKNKSQTNQSFLLVTQYSNICLTKETIHTHMRARALSLIHI